MHRNMNARDGDSRQAGQAIVIVALVMIALLAFTALAIDGGQLYWTRRSAQNAADGAAMAGAYAKCTGGNFEEAAYSTAAANGFSNDDVSTVTVNNPPSSGAFAGNPAYVEVIVSTENPSHFAHFVYKGPLAVTTHAVGYCEPVWDGVTGSAIYAGATECQSTIDLTPNDGTIIGGIHSNNEIHTGGNILEITGSATYVDDAGVWPETGGPIITYDPEEGNPSQLPEVPAWGDEERIYPVHFETEWYSPTSDRDAVLEAMAVGEYYACLEADGCSGIDSQWLNDQGLIDEATGCLKDGLYYSEGDISLSSGPVCGDHLTFVAHDPPGGVLEGVIKISSSNATFGDPYIDGLFAFTDLSYKPEGQQCSKPVINISGSNTAWQGIIFAPNGGIDMTGSGISSLYGSLFGYTVKISGGDFSIIYNPDYIPGETPDIFHAE